MSDKSAVPSDTFCVRYVQDYLKRFNKTPEMKAGVIENWDSREDGLMIRIFMPLINSRAERVIKWEEVLTDAESMKKDK